MSDELFRARVEPRRSHSAAADGRPPGVAADDGHAEEVLEDLMASFERRSAGLARLQEPDDAGAADFRTGDPRSADDSFPQSWSGTDPATLPSRRHVPSHRRAREPWLIGGAALVITAGVAAAVLSGPLFGDDPQVHGTMTGATALGRPSAPSSSQPSDQRDGPMAAAGPSTGRTPDTVGGSVAAAALAADWIAAHIGAGRFVACDVTVCQLLRDRGVPDAGLVNVGSSLARVEQADVVAVSDGLRRQVGAGLAGVTAAEPLAVFSAGGSTVSVVPVWLKGPVSYAGKLDADRDARKAAGSALLRNSRITVTGAARTALAGGLVDARVCALLATLGGSHRVVVAGFTGVGPGAGPDYPLPGVVISEIDGVAAAGGSPQAAQLKSTVLAQRVPYAPLSVAPGNIGAEHGLTILFVQPGPLGLLTGAAS